jgi:signal transduction histidine kinase
MRRLADNIVGVVGLLACLAIGLLDSIDTSWVVGPQNAIPTRFDSTLATQLAAAFVDDVRDLPLATFRVHLVFRLILVAVFAAALWVRTSPAIRRTPAQDLQLLGTQIFIALLGPTALVHVLAAELGIVLAGRLAWQTLGALILADVAVKMPFFTGVIGDLTQHVDPRAVIMCIAWDSVLHPVFFGMGLLFSAERRGRAQLARAHAELLATQQLLADAVRASERARIARDLHDALGHHLTALNLHLELATRHSGGADIESLRISRELAQRLLAEVRVTVNVERRQRVINLRQALETLCAGIPFPSIALTYDERIEIREPTLADTVFRTVQEAITNAVRHSRAAAVNVNLRRHNDGLAISVSDDGDGAPLVEEGHGLTGIRERVESLGGQLRTASGAEGGFRLSVWLPQLASAP